MKPIGILKKNYNLKKRIFRHILTILISSTLPLNIVLAQNTTSFSVGSVEAGQGEKVNGSLIVDNGIDKGTFIPVTVINGVKSGPVLTIVAGIHGTEYVPVIALQKLVKEINPDELTGTLILIHIANVPGFASRTPYSGLMDGKNLNRVFPGKINGTVSERIAHTLSKEVMSKSDYYIDLHGGEFNERILEYLYYCSGDTESDLCKKSIMMAKAMGNKYLIPYEYTLYPDSLASEYSEQEAFRKGVAAITLEWGDSGIVKPGEIEFALKGIKNVMKTIGMLEGEPFVNEHPIYLINETSVSSNYDGILYTFVDTEDYIAKGTLIGYTTDYWGNVLEEYHSKITGLVVSVKVAPSINKGEKVCDVAEVSDDFEK